MKLAKKFFLIGGLMCLLLSVITLVMNTEIEYENKALCIYIDYAITTLYVSIANILIGIIFLIMCKNIDNDDDFSHISRKY